MERKYKMSEQSSNKKSFDNQSYFKLNVTQSSKQPIKIKDNNDLISIQGDENKNMRREKNLHETKTRTNEKRAQSVVSDSNKILNNNQFKNPIEKKVARKTSHCESNPIKKTYLDHENIDKCGNNSKTNSFKREQIECIQGFKLNNNAQYDQKNNEPNRTLNNRSANQCFINSLLQCLTTIKILTELKISKQNDMGELIEILKFLKHMSNEPQDTIEHYKRNLIKKIGYANRFGDPLDSYLYVLELIQSHQLQDPNINKDFLYLKKRQIISCNCNKERHIDDDSTNVIFLSTSEHYQSLNQLLKDYINKEQSVDFECPKCRKGKKNKNSIIEFPDYLVLRIERKMLDKKQSFYYDNETDLMIEEEVEIDGKNYMIDALVLESHIHATAIVKNQNGFFYHYNDNTTPKQKDIRNYKNPYLVFLSKNF